VKRFTPGLDHTLDALAAALNKLLRAPSTVLEIGAGTGQHAAAFAARMPSITWIPSEVDPGLVDSIAAWRADAALPNLRPPLLLDARSEAWDAPAPSAIVAIDFVTAVSWAATVGLVRGAARSLLPGGDLLVSGRFTDDQLADLVRVAASHRFEQKADHDLGGGARFVVLRLRG
jgi:SAM-dependent methyltransferase